MGTKDLNFTLIKILFLILLNFQIDMTILFKCFE